MTSQDSGNVSLIGLPCPIGSCRATHLTEWGAAEHLRRVHDDAGRWGPDPLTDGGIIVSEHARDRWRRRSKQTRYCPRGAWESGVPVWQFPCDAHRVRYHQATRTVLLAKNGVIVTALDFDEMSNERQAAVRRALGD
jgi:hypothetical protein